MTKKTYAAIITACLLIFIILVWLVNTDNIAWLDDPIRNFLYEKRCGILTDFMIVVTFLGNWQIITGICVVMLLVKKTRVRYGLPIALGAVSVTIVNNVLKVIIKRMRPNDITHLVLAEGYSFPSGHSITSMCVYGLLIYLIYHNFKNCKTRNLLIVLLSIPLIGIGISRVYLGVHYPSDVLAGWMLGITIMNLVILFLINRFFSSSSVEEDAL